MAFFVPLGLSAGVMAVLSIWEGFVLTKLWAWFVVIQFGLAPLSIPMAIGISLLIGFLTHQMRSDTNDETMEVVVKLFSHGFVNAGVVLLTGWIVTFFM